MGLKDLKFLTNKKYRIFLILIIWFVVGFIFIQYGIAIQIPNTLIVINGVLIFYPLLILCLALFLAALIFRADLIDPSKVTLIKILILIALLVLVSIYFGVYFLTEAAYFLFVISIFSYVFLTSVFIMLSCYEKGVKLDDKIRKSPKKNLRFILRLFLFLGGLLIAIASVYFVISLGGGTGNMSSEISDKYLSYIVESLPYLLIYIYIGFAILTIIIAFFGKFNAWLGIFFLITSIYAMTMLIDIFQTTGGGDETAGAIITIISFSVDLFIMIFTMSGLLGDKADWIEEKLKIVKSEAIIVWLIFSKAAYEFAIFTLAETELFGTQVSILQSLGAFLLFLPLLVLFAIFGIRNYLKKT